MMTSYLDMLCHPLSRDELSALWRAGTWYLLEHPAEHLEELASMPELSGVDAVLRAMRGGTLSAYSQDAAGELVCVPQLRPVQAARVFAMGATLACVNFESYVPKLQHITRELAVALGVRPESVSVVAFCSPARAKVAFLNHFDPFDTLAVQLHGTKAWDIGSNSDVRFPLHPWPMSTAERAEPEPMAYMPNSWSSDRGPHIKRVVLRPGSVMFIGRGCWHRTGDVGEECSISLSFVFALDSYGAIVRQALSVLMAADAEWREPGLGVLPMDRDSTSTDLEERVAMRLARLSKLLGGMSARELLDAYARACNAGPRESR